MLRAYETNGDGEWVSAGFGPWSTPAEAEAELDEFAAVVVGKVYSGRVLGCSPLIIVHDSVQPD